MTRIYHAGSPIAGFPKLFIVVLAGEGKLSLATHFSLMRAVPMLIAGGIAFETFDMGGNCHVDDARNGSLRAFMASDCTDLVFIDADVGFQPEDLVKLARYTSYDVVAGVYPKKTPDGSPPEYPYVPIYGETMDPVTGLLRVARAPTGFMKIRRFVVEQLMEANKARSWVGQHEGPESKPYVEVFRRDFVGRERLSGDYFFCHQWTERGGHIWVAPDMKFIHEGPKEWYGCLGDELREAAGVFPPDLVEGVERLKAGRADGETFALLFAGWRNGWSATPELLSALYMMAFEADGPILETGSGLSTLVLAIGAANGFLERCRMRPEAAAFQPFVHTLEHDPVYMMSTQHLLQSFHVDNVALHYAPLEEHGEEEEVWYGVTTELPAHFELVFVDGPPGQFGRRGLFTMFGPNIEGAALVIDDVARDNSWTWLRPWATERDRSLFKMGNQRTFAVCPKPLSAMAEAAE